MEDGEVAFTLIMFLFISIFVGLFLSFFILGTESFETPILNKVCSDLTNGTYPILHQKLSTDETFVCVTENKIDTKLIIGYNNEGEVYNFYESDE